MSIQGSKVMRWEKVQQTGGSGGPGVRWGHTCNSIRGGKLLYVFGGYGKDQCQTNQVHIFDTVNTLWSEPVMKGTPPVPRDSHSCTTVGDNLFVFGGTDGSRPLNDLYILDTSSNSWIFPSVRGDGPEPRQGYSAAVIGKRLFIFGGCGKSEDNEIYYDDLYILNTETFVWKRVVPSGTPPSKRNSHTCSSWKNKIFVIGGEDSYDYHLSDVYVLDADSLAWCKFSTSGQLLTPRGGHTTISFGKNLIVFGGFSDEQNLYDDVYVLDIEKSTWTKIMAIGEGPFGRFSMAGDSLDPHMGGVLAFIGGCNKDLEALGDMYYLHTGISRETERDERRTEKLSMRKQLKLKVQEKRSASPFGAELEHDATVYQPTPISSYMPSGTSRHTFYLNEYQTPLGKRTFQAKVTKSFSDGYTIETVIDGKPLRGVLFSNKPSSISTSADNSIRKMQGVKKDCSNDPGVHNTGDESDKPMKDLSSDMKQADASQKETEVSNPHVEVSTCEKKNPTEIESSIPQEVPGESKLMGLNVKVGTDATNNPPSAGAKIQKENAFCTLGDQITPPS